MGQSSNNLGGTTTFVAGSPSSSNHLAGTTAIPPVPGSGPFSHTSNPIAGLAASAPNGHVHDPIPGLAGSAGAQFVHDPIPVTSQGPPSSALSEAVPTTSQGPASTDLTTTPPLSSQGPPSDQVSLAQPEPAPPPAGPPPVVAGPVVPVAPPTPDPDISGVAAIYTDPTLTPPQRRAQIAKANSISNLRVAARVATQRYTGPAFPLGPSINGTLGPKDDVSVVMTSYVNILSTPRGSVPYDLSIGSDVPLLVFEPLDDITLNLIRYYTRKDLSEQEPRAVVRQVFARVDPVDPNRILVDVGTSLVGDPDGTIYGIPVVFTREAVGGI